MGGLCLAPRGRRILPLAAGAGYWAGDVAGEAAWVWERVPDATFVWELRDGKVITTTLYQHYTEAAEDVGLREWHRVM
jgi:hypothetical protein